MEIKVEKYDNDKFIASVIGVGSVSMANCTFDSKNEALEAAAVALIHLMLIEQVHADSNIIHKVLNDFYPNNIVNRVHVFQTSEAIEFFIKNGYEKYLEESALQFKKV
jgi:hypothetical protein